MNTPLSPDALEAGARALLAVQQPEVSADYAWNVQFEDGRDELRNEARAAVSAYLAVAQPVVNSVEANKALLREAMAMGWDDAIKAMQYPDGSPVEIMINQNPYRGSKP